MQTLMLYRLRLATISNIVGEEHILQT